MSETTETSIEKTDSKMTSAKNFVKKNWKTVAVVGAATAVVATTVYATVIRKTPAEYDAELEEFGTNDEDEIARIENPNN